MIVREVAGVLIATLVLAGLAYAIFYGQNTAAVLSSATGGWATIVKSATFQTK